MAYHEVNRGHMSDHMIYSDSYCLHCVFHCAHFLLRYLQQITRCVCVLRHVSVLGVDGHVMLCVHMCGCMYMYMCVCEDEVIISI